MLALLLITFILIVFEIKFSPRLIISSTNSNTVLYLFYNIKSKTEGITSRDYIKIIEIKKNKK